MTAKQYLKKLAQLQMHIEALTAEIEARRDRLASPSGPKLSEKVQSSPDGDRLAAIVASIADRDIERQRLLVLYEALRDDIVDQILGLDDPVQSKVLYERYVRNKQLREIAEELHYEHKYLCRLHGRALMAFTIKYPDVLRDLL